MNEKPDIPATPPTVELGSSDLFGDGSGCVQRVRANVHRLVGRGGEDVRGLLAIIDRQSATLRSLYDLVKEYDLYGTGGDVAGCIREMLRVISEERSAKARAAKTRAALTACHSAMLGNVNPKHPAWGVLYAAQDENFTGQRVSEAAAAEALSLSSPND